MNPDDSESRWDGVFDFIDEEIFEWDVRDSYALPRNVHATARAFLDGDDVASSSPTRSWWARLREVFT